MTFDPTDSFRPERTWLKLPHSGLSVLWEPAEASTVLALNDGDLLSYFGTLADDLEAEKDSGDEEALNAVVGAQDMPKFMELARVLLGASLVKPRLAPPEREDDLAPDEIKLTWLHINDIIYLLTVAMGGAASAATFPEEQAPSVDAVQPGGGVEQQA